MLHATNVAARSLITLASPTKQKEDSGLTTPPRKDSIQNMEYESPDHTRHVNIKCKGTKRPRENLVLVLYDAGDTELAKPFHSSVARTLSSSLSGATRSRERLWKLT